MNKVNKHKKLKIAIVSDAIYPYNKGGKEKRIYEISRRLVTSGHEVHIYCMQWWKGKKKHRIENGVHLHAISKLYPLYSGQRRSIRQALLFAFSCFKLLKEDFDVIDVDNVPFFPLFTTKIVCLLKRKKMTATWLEVWGKEYWIEYMGKLGYIAYLIEKLSLLLPDQIIPISQHTSDKLIKYFKVKKSMFIVPAGINYQEIRSIKASPQKSDIIFAGRLLSHKNIDYLISAISLLKKSYPTITCIIIGKGPEGNKLKNLAKELQIEKNIIFYDFLKDHKDLYALMKASKVFVFPSTREGFGIVALEANACGIPVIAIDHPNNATACLIEKRKNGLLSKFTADDLAKKIAKLLKIEMENTCMAFAKKYDWSIIYRNAHEVYINL